MPVELEEFQRQAADFLRTRKRAMVVAPAGSGKTIVAAAGLDLVLRSRKRSAVVKIGWMGNTREQIAQAKAALQQFPAINSLAEVKIACAAAGTDWSDRHALVIDEVHHLTADEWLAQAKTCSGTIWGFTATPDTGDEERYTALKEFFENEIFTIPRRAARGRLTGAVVRILRDTDPGLREVLDRKIRVMMNWRVQWMRKQGLPFSEGELWSRIAWQVCARDGIMYNEARNAAVIRIANEKCDTPTLILVNQVKHGEALCKQIPRARMCHSKMGVRDRREAIGAFKQGTINCLVATSLADEGLDLPNAQLLLLASGGRSKAKAEQRTGRVLRVWKDKPGAEIIDFADLGHPLLAKHSRVRQELYDKLGYEVYGRTT